MTKYEYDDNGNQTASVDAKGRRTTYRYDDLGNLTKTMYPDGTFESFTYDANGNNINATDRSGLTVTMKQDNLSQSNNLPIIIKMLWITEGRKRYG